MPPGVAPWLVQPAGGVPIGLLDGPTDPQTTPYWSPLHLSTGSLYPSPQMEQVAWLERPKQPSPLGLEHETMARAAEQPPAPASFRLAGHEHARVDRDSGNPVPMLSEEPEQAPASSNRETSSLGAVDIEDMRMRLRLP